MATAADFISQLDTAFFSPAGIPKATSDMRRDQETITAGTKVYQMFLLQISVQKDSNVAYEIVAFEVSVHHYLSDSFDERAYTQSVAAGGMLNLMSSLLEPNTYRNLASVNEVQELSAEASDLERKGNVVSFAVNGTVRLVL